MTEETRTVLLEITVSIKSEEDRAFWDNVEKAGQVDITYRGAATVKDPKTLKDYK